MHAPYMSEIKIARPAALGGGEWDLSELNSITVLFGKNGSGKSLLLRAWRDQNPDSHHYVVPERTGELNYQANYLTQQLSGAQRGSQSSRNYISEYRSQIVARIQAYFSARGNVRGNKLPGDPGDLERLLGQLIPDFEVELKSGNPPYKFVRTSDARPIQNVDEMSSGEAQLLTIGLDILTIAAIWDIEERSTRLMLVDEPDAHIHPDLQVRFADFLISVGKKFKLQTVVATHSTTLMAAIGQFGNDSASTLYLDRTRSKFKAQKFTEITKELAACLGGHALMGPLFGVPILLVEGDDDYRIWSQVPRYHGVSFAAIPSNGEEIKRYQRTLEQIFSSLQESGSPVAGYALIDHDKGKPHPNSSNPQDHVKFIQLACHESENLYLSDEVLALLGLTWQDAKEAVINQASNFGNKANQLRAVEMCDRKTADIKNIIEEISRILDSKNIHWTVRVAQAIGRNRPNGQLGEFIGDEVISALWHSEPLSTKQTSEH